MEAVCAEWCWLDDGQALPRAIIVSELAAEGSTSGLELNSVCLCAFFVLFFFCCYNSGHCVAWRRLEESEKVFVIV